ncbi:hypothetical protein AAC387_Pa12g1096 [Persea americana]
MALSPSSRPVSSCKQSFDSAPSSSLWNNLISAKLGLHEALKAQDTHWKQRSRINWLKEGDQNTKFFYQSAKARSSFNNINHISINGIRSDDPLFIQGQAVDFFSNLYKPYDGQLHHIRFQTDSPKVSDLENSFLIYLPSASKIKEAVFALKKNSSPGPDGFNGAFSSNAFFLSLIPKSKSPDTFADFRPIILLNFFYKIISKILTTRLTAVLPKLISPHQAAFIKGRSIRHHSALAFELFQKLNSKLSKGSFCLKLDISKAFDKLNWSFLFSCLRFFEFSEAWISLISECIYTTRCSILINRSPQGFFSSSCGLRQGDPLSPYLFIIVEEILSLHIQNLQSQGIISPLSTVLSTPCHLLYAHDIIIFMKGASSGVFAMQDLLDLYQSSSGQHFNLLKSQLIFGKCVHRRKSRICSFLGLQENLAQFKYLSSQLPLVLSSESTSSLL